MSLDYEKLGLRIGFEIHQELETHKLFCECPSRLRDEKSEMVVARRLRPTQSEMGEVDRAALAEAIKGKGFGYQLYPDSVCLVELDEEPPHLVNEEALDVTLQIALMLNAKPVDEIHTMRKIVIDGSNTAGFQRTMLVATDGFVEVEGKKFSIPTICLEEDAARKMGEDESSVDYRLDRLGIPLVEIATGAEFSDPETPAKVALYIGQMLRATGRVKRGIGTIRQDINISIARGARQEIKGVQELKLIPEVIRREVQRQLGLLEIRDELKRRGAQKVRLDIFDVSEVFKNTDCEFIRRALERGGGAFAVRLPKFAGLIGLELQPGRRFGTELADRARLYGKVSGIFHTDEIPRYGISGQEVKNLKETLRALDEDAVIIVADVKQKAEAALEAVIERVNQAFDGVLEGTRRALPDGNTEFMRPLPGAERMYPETDIPPISVTGERLRRLRAHLPELPEKKVERFMESYGLSRELAKRMVFSENLPLFEKLIEKTGAEPTTIAATLEETLVSIRREGVKVENIRTSDLEVIFSQVASGTLARGAIPEVLKVVAGGLSVDEAVEKLGLRLLEKSEVEKLVGEAVRDNLELVKTRGMGALGPLMGVVMEKVRGRADGKLVHELLRREIEKLTSNAG
jgi:glutamyl-tRNA(Gln) amidotransferase subunit E